MTWIVLALLLIVSAWFFSREVMALGAARREGKAEERAFRRFRRRTKGLLLLILLYVGAAFYEDIAALCHFTLRDAFLYSGGFLILLFWLLITASRDFKDTAFSALHERQRMTLESIAEIEEELRRRRESEKDGNSVTESELPPAAKAKHSGKKKRK